MAAIERVDLRVAATAALRDLILDGELEKNNLHEAGFDELWLQNQLSSQGITQYQEVLYAEWRGDEGQLYVTTY